MNQLKCEMCGSTDVLKQDGMFVCQVCGTKYSVEEAKKMMMMIEGVVEIKNAAQFDNLLNMARSSFDSENYAKAEEFCNQVIAMDGKNYEAWKLKGKAINYQITATNQRILEVYNCIMTSYRILDEKDKVEHVDEILNSLKECLEGEVKFWLEQFERMRPSESTLNKVKSTHIDCFNKLAKAFDEFGLEDVKNEYLLNFNNYFITLCNNTCLSAWESTVGYNYYRDDFKTLGKNWEFNEEDGRKNVAWSIEFRPNKDIFKTFIEETDFLIELEKYAEEQFNDKTTFETKNDIYSNIIFLHNRLIDGRFFDLNTSNPYAPAPYWTSGGTLTAESKKTRRTLITLYEQKKKFAHGIDALRQFNAYLDEHPNVKAEYEQLQEQKDQLTEKIGALQKSKANVPSNSNLLEIEKKIRGLQAEKNALGIFKLKEKKAVQEKIDNAEQERVTISKRVEAEQKEIDEEITPLRTQLNTIISKIKNIESATAK